jgi:hypothetical protein
MTNDQIENFFQNAKSDKSKVQINFKSRSPIIGLFIKTADYSELKSKNFWRIVSESKIEEFLAKNDMSVSRIFNGTEMTRLNLVKTAS